MLRLKEFLEQECRNVRQLLNDTLRNAYSVEVGKKFYLECSSRVDTLERQIRDVAPDDLKTQGLLSSRLSELSELIAGIERSHIGEFSWPFAEALNQLAVDICKHEEALPSPEFDPLFFISAEGGLLAYSVSFEPLSEEMSHAKNRIFNVIFPRSLKHSVLLHPILGHEIGHAAYSHINMCERLDREVLDPLLKGSKFADVKSLKDWFSRVSGVHVPREAANEIFEDWKEELLCDLFGLVVMGPSFVMAHRSLLRTIDPPGNELSSTHPPKLTRYWMIDVATRHLEWDEFAKKAAGPFASAVKSCHESCGEPLKAMPKEYKVFREDSIRNAVDGLKQILGPINGAVYKIPPYQEIEAMVARICEATPPIRTIVSIPNGRGASHNLENPASDFRSILLAGWLAWHKRTNVKNQIPFSVINRLCDLGLLHLQGISKWNVHEHAMGSRNDRAKQAENS
jgi:hypothetical protein